jgi:hypothetical protein
MAATARHSPSSPQFQAAALHAGVEAGCLNRVVNLNSLLSHPGERRVVAGEGRFLRPAPTRSGLPFGGRSSLAPAQRALRNVVCPDIPVASSRSRRIELDPALRHSAASSPPHRRALPLTRRPGKWLYWGDVSRLVPLLANRFEACSSPHPFSISKA